jgi:signal transduction histidine kinase
MRRHLLPTAAALLIAGAAIALGALAVRWSPAAAALGFLAFVACACGVTGRLLARRLRAGYEVSIEQTIRALDAVRDGTVAKVPLVGPPDMQALMRKVNLATSAAEERKRTSQANLISLEVAFDRIHSVLNSLSEGVIVIDGMREVVIANPAARARLRGDQKVIEGRPIVDLLDGELRDHVQGGLDMLPDSADGRILLTGIDHGERVLDVSIVRVKSNRTDQDFGTVLVLVDVTATHEAARLKDRFLSSVSHELRTPLTNICSFAELLDQQLREGTGQECGEFADIIQKEGRRLSALVDDVLDYNALENNTGAWDDVDVDMLDVVQSACARARPTAEAKFLQFEVPEVSGAQIVRGDREQLLKVLGKLLDNAIKFTPGGGTVRVDVRALAGFVQVSVADSGIGVAAEHREAIFEKFTQLGDPLTDKPAGAGLGLAISRRIVDRAGGKIWCSESDLGGACISFLLPLAVPATARG